MRSALLFAAASFMALAAFGDEEVTHPFSASVPSAGIRRVVVDLPAGEVTVQNGPAGQIRISGEVRRNYDGYNQREKQQRIVNDVTAAIEVSGSDAIIARKFGSNAGSWSARSWHSSFRLTVEVPRGTALEIGTRYGELHFDGDFGDINADLRAGEIHLRMPQSSVHELNASVRVGEVHTFFGERIEDHEGIFPGSTHFVNAGGRSRINVHTTVGELHVTLTK